MLLLDLIEWAIHHPGEFLFRSLILILLRNLIHIAKEEEIHWIRERVEKITGEKYPGHTKRLWRRAVRSSKSLFSYLPKAMLRENLRRRTNMNQNINWVTLIVSLLGAIKLVLQMFGIQIPDQNINEIANGAAALVNIVGIIMSHRKEGATNGLPQFTNTIGNNK
jgi:uncharacterized membrane protein